MDNTFQVINEILFGKKESILNEDELKLFVPFLTNRYASMYSPEMCEYINTVLNNKRLGECLEASEMYRMFWTCIPKLKFKKIDYIKKTKKEKQTLTKKEEEFQTKLKLFAKNNELSLKEINSLLEFAEELNTI